MRLPFRTEMNEEKGILVFVASNTKVYTDEGLQWEMIVDNEFWYLLENNGVDYDLYFKARCSVNVLCILKEGL